MITLLHVVPLLLALGATPAPAPAAPAPTGKVVTLGAPPSLAYELVNGVKVFHLTAEVIEHEVTPGMKLKVWGYNGITPGPTIEATEGDRVRIAETRPVSRLKRWRVVEIIERAR